VLVSAVGALCEPSLPDIPGLGDFDGQIFHSARWDHTADLTGERVAFIGTGASAVHAVTGATPPGSAPRSGASRVSSARPGR